MELKVGDKVSVIIDTVVCPGTATSIEDGICEIDFDDGDDGAYPVGEVKIAKPPKSKKEIEEAADRARRAGVDEQNRKMAAQAKAKEAKLVNVPLTEEERAFIAEIAPRMNEGRQIMQPSSADILRYSRLKKREDVK